MENLQKPKVSIVTGYYNREDFVRDSIESLLNQTYENIEIIIFDDASKDNTLNNIYETVGADDRVKIIAHKNNIGFVNGLIHAIESSTGEYIAIHGSGDISLPERIEKQAEFLNQNIEYAGVSCFYRNIDPINNIEKRIFPRKFYSREELFKSNPFSHGEVMFRKEIYILSGGYRSIFRFSQDRDLWLRMSELGNFGAIQEFLYNRIVNFSGVSYNPVKLVQQKRFSILAVSINKLDSTQQIEVINRVENLGIESVVKNDNKDFQKHIFFMSHVLLFKDKLGNFEPFFHNSVKLYFIYYKFIYILCFVPGFRFILKNTYLYLYKYLKN